MTTETDAVAHGWQTTDEHDSAPFYMDGSGRAANDLRP